MAREENRCVASATITITILAVSDRSCGRFVSVALLSDRSRRTETSSRSDSGFGKQDKRVPGQVAHVTRPRVSSMVPASRA